MANEAAAKAKAEAEAKAKAEAEAKAKEKQDKAELRKKAGITPLRSYSTDAIRAAQTAMNATDALVLGNIPGTVQLSLAGSGTWIASSTAGTVIAGDFTVNEGFATGIKNAASLARAFENALAKGAAALVNSASLSAAVVIAGLWPRAVGEGSDKVPMLLSFPLDKAGIKHSLQPGDTSVDLPVRGSLVEKNGQIAFELLKTGNNGPSRTVPVLNAVRDAQTGLDRITIPAMQGKPPRNILINPIPINTGPSHTGGIIIGPATPINTGTDIKPVENITTTPNPAVEEPQDFIYWRLNASETGVEAIYVVLSNPETNAIGKYSGRKFNTDKAGGPIEDLDWKNAKIDRAGIDKVKLHTVRFGEDSGNKIIIDRLEKILKGELAVTDTDKRFYTHEIRELERYRNLGVKDGEVPKNKDEVWNNAHTATLEDYKLNSDESLFYTPEALNSQIDF
jgi:hypothetical protein